MNEMSAAEEFDVVDNEEGQYSVWRWGRTRPEGWSRVGISGTKEHCLEYIEGVWADLRPLSLRSVASRSSDTHDARGDDPR